VIHTPGCYQHFFYSMGNTIPSLVSLPDDFRCNILRETFLSVRAALFSSLFFVRYIGHAAMSSRCTRDARVPSRANT
jgi:hypothetical protein